MRKKCLVKMAKKLGMGVSVAMLAGGLTACGGENKQLPEERNIVAEASESSVAENEESIASENEESGATVDGSNENSEGDEMDIDIREMTGENAGAKEETSEESAEQTLAEVEVNEDGIYIMCPSEYLKKSADVKYSELIRTKYYSTTCEKERNVNILLPADYSEDKEYPVLYFLHGIFGDENSMIGCGPTIENMMAKGAAEEMIIVFPYMYASKTQDVCTAIDDTNIAAYDNFVNDLVTDLMPFIKENYSVKEGKENTAIVGFSMGGRESLAIGLLKPDLFGYVGAISPAPGLVPGKDWAIEHPGQFKEEEVKFGDEKPYLLMICCGDSDKVVGTFPESYHQVFEKNEVDHIWWVIPGSDHGDPAISSGVYNFCGRIFR